MSKLIKYDNPDLPALLEKTLVQLNQIKTEFEEMKLRQDKTDHALESLVTGYKEKLDMAERIDRYEEGMLNQTINERVYRLAQLVDFQQLFFDGDVVDADVRYITQRIFPKIHTDIRRKFGVNSYRDVRRSDFRRALSFVERWRPSGF